MVSIEVQGSSDHLYEFSRINVGSNIVQQASDELWIKWKIYRQHSLCVEWLMCFLSHFTIALPGNILLHYTLPWFSAMITTILYQQSSTWLYSIYWVKHWEYGDTCKSVVIMTIINKSHLGCEWRVISVPPKVPHPPPPWQTLWPEGSTSELTSIYHTPLYHLIQTAKQQTSSYVFDW